MIRNIRTIGNIKEIIEKNSDYKVNEKDLENLYESDRDEYKKLHTNLMVIDETKDLTSAQKKTEMEIALNIITLPKKVRDLYNLNPSNMIEEGSKPLYTMLRSLSVLNSKPSKLAPYLLKNLDDIMYFYGNVSHLYDKHENELKKL